MTATPPQTITAEQAQQLLDLLGAVFPVLLILLMAFLGMMLGRWAAAGRAM